MKKRLFRLFLSLAILIGAGFLAHDGLLTYARRTLAVRFPGAQTVLGGIRVLPSGVTLKDLSIKTADWEVMGDLTADFRGELAAADLRLSFYRSGDFEVRNARLSLPAQRKPGSLRAQEVRWKKMALTGIEGVAKISGKRLMIDPLGTSGPYGQAVGNVAVTLEEPFPYEARLDLFRVAPASILRILEWDSKATLTGLFTGHLEARGSAKGPEKMEGRLQAETPGGELNITHKEMFDDLAARTKQPVELIEAGFSRYHFDTGSLSLSTDGRDLQADLLLEGPSGKRRLQPVIHDFFK